jgi:outer membrane protein assembly factor BamB
VGGCPVWELGVEGDAVARVPGTEDVLVVDVDGEGPAVVRANASTGEVVWQRPAETPPADGGPPASTADVAVDAERGRAYVAWHAYDHEEPDDRYERSRAALDRGGLAAVELADGEVAWQRDAGTAPVALGPHGDRLYHAWVTEGDQTGLSTEPWDRASIEVAAVDAATGERTWQNGTDLWWRVHAPASFVDGGGQPFCDAGPADVTVDGDGRVYAARSQACGKLPGAVVGFTANGTLARTWTFPRALDDPGAPEVAQTDAALAMHPDGDLLYVTGNRHVAAYDTRTGQRLWAWNSTWLECAWDERSCQGPGGPGAWENRDHDHGSDLAVTPLGQVLVTGFDHDPGERGDLTPRLVVLDGLTGETLNKDGFRWDLHSRPDVQSSWEAFELEGEADLLDSTIAVAGSGVAAVARFQVGDEARVLGYPLVGDLAGPVWKATDGPGPSGRPVEVTDARDVAVAGDTVVLGREASSGHAQGALLQAMASGALGLPDEATATRGDGTRAGAFALHGSSAAEGTPALIVQANDSRHANVTLDEPGERYVLLEGVNASHRYAFQAAADQTGPIPGHGQPSVCSSPVEDPEDLVPTAWEPRNGPCTRETPRACTSDAAEPGLRPHPAVDGSCWATDRGAPVTVTQADRVGDRDVENGSALFGPLPLTEGDYAITRTPDPWVLDEDGDLEPSPLTEWTLQHTQQCAAQGQVPEIQPTEAGLEKCLHVRVDRPSAGVKAPASSRSESSGGCEHRVENVGTSSTIAMATPEDVSTENRVLFESSVLLYGKVLERYYDHGRERCRYETGSASARATFLVNGSNYVGPSAEWTVTTNVETTCTDEGERGKDCGELPKTRMRAHGLSTCVPDQETVHVAEILGEPGTTGAEEGFRRSVTELFKAILDVFGYGLLGLSEASAETFGAARDQFVAKECQTAQMDGCGLGCREWTWSIRDGQTFLHRQLLEASGCDEASFPVNWGIENAMLDYVDHRGAMWNWGFEGTTIQQTVPVKADPPWEAC